MAKTDLVPIFYRDQDEVCERPAKVWSRDECRKAKKILGNFFSNGKFFRLFALTPKIYPVTAASLKSSNVIEQAATISTGELLANVGIAGPEFGAPAPRHIVRRAQAKVRAYPNVHDDQAVVAYGRWYDSSTIRVSVVQ